jgi:hypothetical protein
MANYKTLLSIWAKRVREMPDSKQKHPNRPTVVGFDAWSQSNVIRISGMRKPTVAR